MTVLVIFYIFQLHFRGFQLSVAQGHKRCWELVGVGGPPYKMHSKWHTYPHKLLWQLYSVLIIY